MIINSSIWKEGMYLTGRDYGHELILEKPDIGLIELESEIFNHLMEFDEYRGFSKAIEKQSKLAAERVWHVNHRGDRHVIQ